MGDKMKVYARMWKAVLEKIRVNESIGKTTVNENSGDIGRLTESESSQEIEQNPGELCGLTENKSSQEIGQNSGEMGDLTERKNSQEIGESSGQMCAESKLSQDIEEIPDAADSTASSSVVAVCVEKNSEHAVRWALDTLVSEGGQLTLIYARRPIVAVPTPMGNHLPIALASRDAVAAEMEKVASQTVKLLRPLQQMCHSQKVQTEIIVLEDHNIPRAILKHISESGINKLVMMSSHPLVKRKPKGDDKGPDSRKLKRDNSMKPKGYESRKLNVVDKDLTSDDMLATTAMKPSKSCSAYVISKGKIAKMNPSNTSARDSSSSSEDTSLSGDMTGRRVLDGSETIMNNVNGNQSLEDNRRDYEECFRSRPDTKTGLEELKIELQHTGETYKEAIAFEEAIVASVNCGQNLENNKRNLEWPFITKPNIGSNIGRLRTGLQHRGETYRERIAFVEEIFANENGNEKHENTENLGISKGKLQELLKLEDTIRKLWEFRKAKAVVSADKRSREYLIEEIELATDFFSESLKIGEGGRGPVYKGSLDHTTVAIKVLGTDATRGTDEFKREIEVLRGINHPNVVLLLGTCPERGVLVYEYMEYGSLQDQLFHRDGRASLPWYIRFRIASAIASALYFFHTANPKPIIHLEPAHILLDHNFVSKVSDVGLPRLIPPPVSSTCAYCYMDPEYVPTGTWSSKSDLYALGIILLQLLTAQPPVAIKEKVQTAIQQGSFKEILDKTAGEWPLEETIEFAKLALECTELLGSYRPDLETRVLPELERFKDIANAHAVHCIS